DRLSDLQARDADIIDTDKAKPKAEYGLDQATLVRIEVEEGKNENKEDKKEPTIKQITFRIGAKEAEKGKLYVQVDDWPRINVLEGADKGKPHALWNLVSRPALAYRPRKVLDVAAADLSRVEIKRDKETFALAHEKDKWRLAEPVAADVDL